jgi:AraC-like DNA-binding protein
MPALQNGHLLEGIGMSCNLTHIEKWYALAIDAKWSAATMRKQCGVSARTLHRFFVNQMGESPKSWLTRQRHLEAERLLSIGHTIKEVADALGYAHPSSFSRAYRQYKGVCASEVAPHLNQVVPRMASNDTKWPQLTHRFP